MKKAVMLISIAGGIAAAGIAAYALKKRCC